MHNYKNETPVITQRTSYAEKQFLHTMLAGATLPFVQAALTALIMAIATAGVIYLFDGIDYIKPMIGIGLITFVIIWLMLQRRWLTLTDIERLTGLDLNNDKHVGEVKTGKVRVQIDNVTPQGHIDQQMMFDLPATPEQLKAYAHGIIHEDKTPSETEWSPIKAGKPFSLDQIRSLKDEMIKRGLMVKANNKNSNLGFVHTHIGKTVLKRIDAMTIEQLTDAMNQ